MTNQKNFRVLIARRGNEFFGIVPNTDIISRSSGSLEECLEKTKEAIFEKIKDMDRKEIKKLILHLIHKPVENGYSELLNSAEEIFPMNLKIDFRKK